MKVKLGEVITIYDSLRKPVAKHKRVKGIYPYYGANGIQDYVDKYIFDGLYILIGEDGSVINKDNSPVVNIASGKFWVNNHAHIIQPKNNTLNFMYLYYALKKVDIYNLLTKSIPPKLNQESLKNIIIFIPPVQTQKEIVAVLDKVTSLISMRKEQLEKLDILVKSKFIEMFGDPVLNPKGWEKKKLGEVYTIISGTTPDTNEQKYWNGTNLWVTPAELNNEIYINTTARKITDEAIKAKSLKVIPKFSVLLSSRAPIGKLAINTADMYCNQGFKCFINSKVLHSIYTYFYLLHRVEYIQSLGRGATFKEVSKEIVANIEIQAPPLDLQNQFAEFVEQVEKNKENIKSSLNQLETLYNALMQEYFG